jgi:hypothetical protein
MTICGGEWVFHLCKPYCWSCSLSTLHICNLRASRHHLLSYPQNGDNKDHLGELKKTLYGLKQAPRAWYSRLDKYPQHQGFKRGIAYNNLYIKREYENRLIVVVYVDDIIFVGSINKVCQEFAKEMQKEFEMSMLGELSFFLGL